ncbi:hypothetical protein DL762_008184 [Monosporascus cannonballus]|uniref:Ribosome biogenesis protein Urb1 n=1 Tax=Monosporascus cannonballus TaxID=155416 RepID=A0ABY0H1H0_9PEZI|nr:hypothetical protein DL762_008184 [Monosporascus cannonballus]RYO82705.1 hypothetical protein DL763_008160 [Monosporascus cannonballus]
MAKRKSQGGEGSHAGKRQKTAHEAPTSEDVHTSRQLRQLLSFEQDLRKARHGLQSFKILLDNIVNGEDENSEKLQLVVEYLQEVKPKDQEDEVPVYLPDLMETWSMASQMGNENVMSAAAVVLALLLKIISGTVNLIPHGLGICRTLLQKRQQELIAKNLSADKGKDFIISPTLRLLREAICLDGGALAAPIFRARNNTLKALARNMGLRYLGEGIEDPKKPSVRTNAIQFLLSSLRLLHVEAKRDLLLQKDVVAALMRHLRDDPPHLLYAILDTLRACIVLDKKLPKDVKIKLLNSHSLTRIASLYGYSHDSAESRGDSEGGRPSVEEAAHDFLVAACTDHAAGIMRSQHGYYPEGVDPDDLLLGTNATHSVDFGIDSIPWMNKFDDDVPVRNSLLAEFIQTLRPWSNTKQSELLLAIFEAAPELVAHYFSRRKSFSFEPKLSATWIGYAALLYNVIQTPIPAHFGHPSGYSRAPPPTAIVLGNIIPAPMTLKVMTRCLANKSGLISFYAIRMLVLALQKLARALDMYREASSSADSLWNEAARRLVDDFYQSIPDTKDIISHYRTISEDDLLQREATSRLLLLYYEVIPQLALRSKFDVSPMLLASITKVESSKWTGEDSVMALMELEHLCTIAKYSPDITKVELGNVLYSVAEESQLVESRSRSPGLSPLVAALRNSGDVEPAIWSFLDNCAERCARSPIKYLEMIEEQLDKAGLAEAEAARCCPLMMTIAEQIPFFVSSSPGKSSLKALTKLLSEYLEYSKAAGFNKAFLAAAKELFAAGLEDTKLAAKLSIPKRSSSLSRNRDTRKGGMAAPELGASNGLVNGLASTSDFKLSPEDLDEKLSVSVSSSKDSALLKWSSKTPEELVEEGYAASLIWLLSSEHPSVRKEALTNITKMATKIKESSYEENEQVWLLLMELVESAREVVGERSLPNMTLAFACRALNVLKNPLHCLYEKVNVFLTSGPAWALDRIPLMRAILQDGPSEDGHYYAELGWLLGLLLDGLRAPDDVALFHQRRVFERLFALACNPYLGPGLRVQVLRILYRATTVPGGSDTAITRFGAVGWLETQKAAAAGGDPAEAELYQALIRRLWETCDQQRIGAWSKGGVQRLAEQ